MGSEGRKKERGLLLPGNLGVFVFVFAFLNCDVTYHFKVYALLSFSIFIM